MVYLDNAAATLHKPPQVITAVTEALTTMGNASRGAHAGAMSAARTVYQALGTVDQGAVRFSFSWFNTGNEVDAAIQAVRELRGSAPDPA